MPWLDPVTPGSTHYWLIHPEDESLNFQLHNVVGDNYAEEYEQETFVLIGRGRKTDFGDRIGYNGSLSAQLRDKVGNTARQQREALLALRSEQREIYLRNPFGDLWQVTLADIDVERVSGVGAVEFVDITVPYTEVA